MRVSIKFIEFHTFDKNVIILHNLTEHFRLFHLWIFANVPKLVNYIFKKNPDFEQTLITKFEVTFSFFPSVSDFKFINVM